MPKNTPDAVDLLIEDHRTVQKLFKAFEKIEHGDDEALIEIVETACAELKVHSMIEEEIFYPAVRSKMESEEDEDLLNEATVEHETVDELIDKLGDCEPGDPHYRAYFTVLVEYVEHHLKEEEKELFPKVRKMKELDLAELGAEMQARKQELLSDVESDEVESEEDAAEVENAGPHSKKDGSVAHKRAGS